MSFRVKDFREQDYTPIDNVMFRDGWLPKIGLNAYGVYSCLCFHASRKDSECFPSYATLAKEVGISRNAVILAIQRLEEFSMISIPTRSKGRKSNTILLLHRTEWKTPETYAGKGNRSDKGRPHKWKNSNSEIPLNSNSEIPSTVFDKSATVFNKSVPLPYIEQNPLEQNPVEQKEREETKISPRAESPNVAIYRNVFPTVADSLTAFQREQIELLPNAATWKKTCEWWLLQGYKPRSIGRMIERYYEQEQQPHQGRGGIHPVKPLSNYEAGMRILGLTSPQQYEVIQ